MIKNDKALLLLPPGLGGSKCPPAFAPVCTVCDLGPGTRIYRYPVSAEKKGISAVNTGRFAGGVPIAWAARALTDACAGAACVLLYGGNVGFARQLAPHIGVHVLIPENLPADIPFSAALSRTGAKCVFLIPGFYRLRVSGRRRDFTAVSPREISDFAAGKRPKVFYSKPERSYYINTGNPSCVEFLFFDTADTIIKKAGALLSRGITPVIPQWELLGLSHFPLPGLSS